ncbi:MAG TPA: exodeoxyribonuclease VII small subunit [Candidatus Lachnoclostridium stercoravium]|uniref:Exodeoxyribonuclease 7 small subunit n=1 Tax=Candidatus Lachnoclostridium stercoravium TaxID=2838633 RepID=A0A9D2KN00_9FIRM|nr:exodeoxyribonuclease VII small subunit [Candidatus Lachnoclostridium stercoravium]
MADKKKEELTEEKREEGLEAGKTIEETFERLEELLNKMEDGNCSLEESFRYYEAGIKMIRSCYEKIDEVEKKLIVLNEEDMEQ